jgi:tRNA-modifying protein YgfZ
VDRAEIERGYERALADGVVVGPTARGLLRLTGEQAVWFLQNTITADVDDLPTATWRESCFLTPKGKLISHFRVGRTDDVLWLDVDPPATELADWFVRYRFRTRVDIEDRTQDALTVIGPAAAAIAAAAHLTVGDSTVAFGDRLGDVHIAELHGEAGIDLECVPAEVLEIFRIEAGVGRFSVDYTTDNLPQEAGLTSVTPIDKGCYVGQETVARIHFRGHINKCVRPLVVRDVEAPVGRTLLRDGAAVGNVTSAAWSPRAGDVAVGMVRVDVAESSELDVEGGGVAVVGALPAGTKVKAS